MQIQYLVAYRHTKDRYKTRWELLPVTVDTFTGLDEAISDYLTGYAHLQYEYCLEVINGAAINPKQRAVRFIDLETMAQERVIEDAATRRAELNREAVR